MNKPLDQLSTAELIALLGGIHPSKYIFHYSVTSSRFGTKTN
jgi:hypothetical protein